MKRAVSLARLATVWVLAAFVAGLGAAMLWAGSRASWDRHLGDAYLTGYALYGSVVAGAPLPEGVARQLLPPDQNLLAERGLFEQLDAAPHPAYVTNLSILAGPRSTPHMDGAPLPGLSIAVVSDKLRTPIATLEASDGVGARVLGGLSREMARYCASPELYIKAGQGRWERITAPTIWDCAAAPRDLRLVAAAIGVISLAVLLSLVGNTAAAFSGFARALMKRRRVDAPAPFPAEGPAELRQIVAAVNRSLEDGRAQLERRAMVLSGVSHDLGTPATRLRLRSALIKDDDLRRKFSADIDQMTNMIDGVLTYTRSELNMEDPRQLSLTALIDALIDDYQDTGHPVSRGQAEPLAVDAAGTVFSARPGHAALTDARRVLVSARPMALQRAVSNLIDNALKYGRCARVWLEPLADTVTIIVEDDGGDTLAPHTLTDLTAPFQRGGNADPIQGYGLGLTIANTVAEQHGGGLSFARGAHGLRAQLEIRRS